MTRTTPTIPTESDEIAPPAPNARSVSKAWLRALELTAPIGTTTMRTFPTVIAELADQFAGAPALISDRETLTYRALTERADRYARWALAQGLRKGETVGLLMPNRPEYMAIWLGINRVGGVVALLNTNLAGASLAHCINAVSPKHVIAAAELLEALDRALAEVATDAKIWSHGAGGSRFPDITSEIGELSGDALDDRERVDVTIDDLALYVYTSGTTGLPKAANITHYRLMIWTHWFAGMMQTRPDDRMYNCLPLYHSIGGAVATGAVLVNGGSVVIRDKFSARQFWDDVVRFECTLFQYIGELCRYLLHAPEHPRETQHRLRLCCGNGLRGDIWDEFKRRFGIPRILEFYAATEANVSLFNVEGRPGAIGRIPPFLTHRSGIALVKFDIDSAAPVRDHDGFCIRSAVDEIGEAIGRISAGSADRGSRFDGYTSPEATQNKILRNVFEPGDAWFRTGDLMRRDDAGFYYFVDRIGDTYRWKGENVATSEVAAAITAFPGIVDANVYGVAIPGADGRAGMAEIVCTAAIDLIAFRDHLARCLPKYAHPVLLRFRREIEVTATFKHKHRTGGTADYDPSTSADALYFLDPESRAFVALDAALYEQIRAGKVRP